jgi:signal transduction histidine kinase
VDRFVTETADTFRIFVDADLLRRQGGVLEEEQQEQLIVNMMDIKVVREDRDGDGEAEAYPTLNDLAFLHTHIGDDTPVGTETARCVKDTSLDPPFRCSIAGLRPNDAVPLRDRADDPAFLAGIDPERDTYIGEIIWEEQTPSVVLSVPVRSRVSGEEVTAAVVVGELQLDPLQEQLDGAGFGDEGIFYIADRQGRVIASSRGVEDRGRDVSAELALVPETGARIVDAALAEGQALTLGSRFDADGNGTVDWWLVAEWPVRDAFYPLITVLFVAIPMAFLLLSVVAFLGIRLSRAIVTPIRTVQEGARRIGQGDFSQRLDLHTNDELEELGHALNEMSDDLARLQQVRVAETRAQALAVAVEKEHELEEEKDTLLATASHQFRTPVTALNWNIDLLKTMQLPEQAAPLLEGLAEHSKNLATIASDLLNATAFGAGYRAEPDQAPVDTTRAFTEAAERFTKEFTKKNITVTWELPDAPVLIRGSFAAVRIALEHLVSNAAIYTPEGGTVTLRIRPSEAGMVALEAQDTGIGIPEEEQKHLFDAFFRASNAITMKNVGTGLGLYIVRNIVVGHGGEVRVASAPGQGTTTTVLLPAAQLNS